MKTCTDCGEAKPLTEFGRRAKSKDGYAWTCLPCDRWASRRFRQRNPTRQRDWLAANRDKQREHARRFTRENFAKREAQHLVQYAVLHGRLLKPESCSRCGKVGRIEGHHEDYRLPLDVIWLCSSCHRNTSHEAARRTLVTADPQSPTGEGEG